LETIQKINLISQELNSNLNSEDIDQIVFLLDNDVNIFHLAKTNLEEAITEAIFYISPGF
jgi:hypothetical protein